MVGKSKLWILAGCILCSCVQKDAPQEDDRVDKTRPVETLYEEADVLMKKKQFKSAAKAFMKVMDSYPYSKWATQAQIMEAYCRYQAHQYADAIDGFTIFVKLHPHHKDAPYAHYMIGLSHYERIAIVDRDQDDTMEALKAFQTVLDLYPTCDYAKDAKFKIDFLQNHLAAKEMSVGRFYQREKAYTSAINRFRNVLTLYSMTEQRPEALFRLTECYAALNMREEFLVTYKVLKHNHKSSEWLRYSKDIYKKYIKHVDPQRKTTNRKKSGKQPSVQNDLKKRKVKQTYNENPGDIAKKQNIELPNIVDKRRDAWIPGSAWPAGANNVLEPKPKNEKTPEGSFTPAQSHTSTQATVLARPAVKLPSKADSMRERIEG